ncbi:MAG: MBL fold metallo-hydrolase RNA specificity domain-containing protein [Nanoarchaeota archaeon]|nr:MBL fold metallo-hydrolase [Nanoarchaeota archaeon]MBU1031190.1 MBL fold metallo-hydrolase [Nanoarchaeota archaeon]MBU1850348.1 MBL fold metallo-hydrolase [Nanoarchaeota archaeon]
MTIEIIPVGGYREVGKNCTAIKVDDEVVLLDLGLHMEKYIKYTDSEDIVDLSPASLIEIGAVPDITILEGLKKQVKAICVSHAHLDHVGAIPFLGNMFNCDIHATPFTIEVLKAIIRDEKISFKNNLIKHESNSKFKVSKNIEIEFISATHSTPQTVMIAVHTKYGTIIYANDFKLDNNPVLGEKTNFKRLKSIKAKAVIMDSLYASKHAKTQSEGIAKEMLKDVLLGVNNQGKNIFITTFSSHIARIKTIIELGKLLNRKIVFLGRSLSKYSEAAEAAGIAKFSKDVNIVKYSSKVKNYLQTIKHSEKYLFVVTGHQGEPKAVLSKIVNKGYFKLKPGDQVIFSCQIIPVPTSFENREKLEASLRQKHVRIFTDVHVSGHAAREDHRDFLELLKPEHIIPTHSELEKMQCVKELAGEIGFNKKNVHLLSNGEILKL